MIIFLSYLRTCTVLPSGNIRFERLADCYGENLCSGATGDGPEGMRYAKNRGAQGIEQHPDEAEFPAMPTAAIKLNAADLVCKLEQMKQWLQISVNGAKT